MLQAPERLKFDWGVPASLFAHAAIAALLIFGLPQLHHDPDEAQPINVELVPPPQTEEPPEPKQEEPEQAVEEEKPPEVEAPQPPPQSETAEAREKPMPPVLRPVFEFGEKDAGTPNAEGNAARDAQAEPAAPADEAGPTPEPLDEEADTTPQPPAAEMTDEPALLEADAPADETVDAELPAIPDLARIPVPEPAPKPPARRAAQGLPPFDHPHLRSLDLAAPRAFGAAMVGGSEPFVVDTVPANLGNQQWKLGVAAGQGLCHEALELRRDLIVGVSGELGHGLSLRGGPRRA